MKILTSDQIREADHYTIVHEPVSSIDLMERAAKTCTDWLISSPFLKAGKVVHIFCGLGNNGGDGLAIARLLSEKEFSVYVYIIRYSDQSSGDFNANEARLQDIAAVKVMDIYSAKDLEKLKISESVVIDAIFGSGFNRVLEEFPAEVINFINKIPLAVIAIDIPSGLSTDLSFKVGKACIRAAHTLTFQAPKLLFMFAEYFKYIGEFTILDIGLDRDFLSQATTINNYTTLTEAKAIIKPRSKFSHKGTYGHALIIAGSYGKIGAAVLASGSCLKSGVGLLTTHVPGCGYEIMQTALPEAMLSIDSNDHFVSILPAIEKYSAIGIGPGLDQHKQTQAVLKILIQNSSVPLVLDADALNMLSENKTWLSFLPKNSVLTPHPKEFERLAGKAKSDYDRYEQLRDFAFKFSLYVVLKGAHTAIACPDGMVYFNSTGNPGMSKGGSGDVLTGIIAGLLAQGYSAKESAILSVYCHGLAGDIASEINSQQSMSATDIIKNMGNAFKIISG
jgi:hydroxyethylthiazole kinase-like uncharacterized protein yjeF